MVNVAAFMVSVVIRTWSQEYNKKCKIRLKGIKKQNKYGYYDSNVNKLVNLTTTTTTF